VDRHFAIGAISDAARWTTTYAATVHAADLQPGLVARAPRRLAQI